MGQASSPSIVRQRFRLSRRLLRGFQMFERLLGARSRRWRMAALECRLSTDSTSEFTDLRGFLRRAGGMMGRASLHCHPVSRQLMPRLMGKPRGHILPLKALTPNAAAHCPSICCFAEVGS